MSLLIDLTKKVRGKNIKKVPPNVQGERLAHCADCPLLRYSQTFSVHYCAACGCPVEDKTAYEDEQCADKENRKWDKYEP